MYQVSLKIVGRMKVEINLVSWRGKKWGGGRWRGRDFSISCFVEYIDYSVMSQTLTITWCLGGKGAKKGKEKVIRKKFSKVWWYRVEKMSLFFIRFLFWYCVRIIWYSPGMVKSDKILGVVLYGLFWKWLQILIVCGMFCNVWVWFVWALTCRR